MKELMARYYNEQACNDASQQTNDHRKITPDWQLKEETNVNAKEGTTVYMETEHEMSNILTSDNRRTSEM